MYISLVFHSLISKSEKSIPTAYHIGNISKRYCQHIKSITIIKLLSLSCHITVSHHLMKLCFGEYSTYF